MRIQAIDLGKKFKGQVVVKGIHLDWSQPGVYAILGGNGSGKSTTLKMLAGLLSPSRGEVKYIDDHGSVVPPDLHYQHISFAGPYHELIEEMTLFEFLSFHNKFREFGKIETPHEIMNKLELTAHADKVILGFSSGMKQRVKLGIALLGNSPLVFLDEPTSHLDAKSVVWYKSLLAEASVNKKVLVASNHNIDEYPNAIEHFNISSL
ncbi:MAG: ABC transporter ATP-binding protein [Flavobacteriales bacterium]|nr:MAG: ABC transporter ATP-binding protein [Flavobacteriales bacterium]